MTTPKPAERCPACDNGEAPSDYRHTCVWPAPDSPAPFDPLCAKCGEHCVRCKCKPQAPAQGEWGPDKVYVSIYKKTNSVCRAEAAPTQVNLNPETDVELIYVRESAYDALKAQIGRERESRIKHVENVAAEHQKEIERLKAERDELSQRLVSEVGEAYHRGLNDMEEQNATLRAELAEAKRDKDTLIDIQIRVGKERDEARAEVERYYNALQAITEDGHSDCEWCLAHEGVASTALKKEGE